MYHGLETIVLVERFPSRLTTTGNTWDRVGFGEPEKTGIFIQSKDYTAMRKLISISPCLLDVEGGAIILNCVQIRWFECVDGKGKNALCRKEYNISQKKTFVRKLSDRVLAVGNELDNLKRFLLAVFSIVLSVRAEHPAPVLNQF